MPTYWYDATDGNGHPDDPSELYDTSDADALTDAEKVRPVTRDAPADGGDGFATDAEAVDAGICPWCDDYEGDHVGRHASSAHPDAWDEYTDD